MLELKETIDSKSSIAVIDFSSSLQYQVSHIPGAYWVVRSRLKLCMSRVPSVEYLVLTSPDGILAHLAMKDVKRACPNAFMRVLDGGNKAWIDAGLPMEKCLDRVTSDMDDIWRKPYENDKNVFSNMQDYLSWETSLIEQIKRDSDINFCSRP